MHSKQRGFSLIELLIVLGLMATAATLALSSVGNKDNQNRFIETRGKLEIIHNAIVGETIKSVKIEQQIAFDYFTINGFLADMGRLPNNIGELLEMPIDPDCDNDPAIDSDGDGDGDIDICPWTYDENNEIWHGWNGPYIFNIGSDYRDGWGFEWDWDFITPDVLIISSLGLDSDLNNNNFEDTDQDAYGDSSLQQITLAGITATLPSAPLALNVNKAPFCGQCRDITYFGNDTTTIDACNAATDREWNAELEYCVETASTTISASTCEAVIPLGTTSWVPLYFGYCSDPTYTNETDCIANVGAGAWNNDDCPLYTTDNPTTPAYDFTDGNVEICARIIRINNGQIVINTHNSTDTHYSAGAAINTPFDITTIGQSATYDESYTSCADTASPNCFSFQPEIEDNSGTVGLTLPHGAMRIGLYEYDTLLNTCTTTPFPSVSSQAISNVITLRSDAPPGIGTSLNPIPLHWRSQ